MSRAVVAENRRHDGPLGLAGAALLVVMTLGRLVVPGPSAADGPVDYTRHIKPVLRERCYACHGVLKSESGLRLDTARFALTGGDSGPVIVPRAPAASVLLARISAPDPVERMPPEGEPLTEEQTAAIRQWIEEGAAAPADERPETDPREHWAFRPPVRPALPQIDDADWVRNPIDALIADRHRERGLTPQRPADRATLLRRVSLDLIGLPPTRDELHEFLSDQSPSAWERLVDRLLNSPQYGERWARHWMDVWRYSDWFGRRMVPDVWNSAPQIWRWRDWIVASLNADKSYARMIQEMLAADEIAPDDPAAAVATGFLIRNWYALNPNDWMRSNVEHTAKAFLGLTYNCAHCHDHKYDPITQHDYFRMRAFFEPIAIRQDRVPGEADPGPFQEYEYSVLRRIVRLGAVSIYDKNPNAPTWFYTGGDERNRDADRGLIPPGLPRIFGGEVAIEPVDLPPAAWYPALRPEIQQTILEERRTAVAECERKLAAARAATDQPSDAHDLSVKSAEAKRQAAQAELASVEARIAADCARFAHAPPLDDPQLTRAAADVERQARIAAAKAAVAEQEHLLAVARAQPDDEAKRQEAVDAATKKLAELREALHEAETAEVADAYTPVGPVYPAQSTGRRRALAEWIGSRDNPLTARVAVNHMWMRHVHAPLVATVFDFGRNGAAPSHPELLDWLAVEFMDSGWSMKHIHRLIVTSRTYQLASSQGDDSHNAALDPENRFLWRMNVGRMEAEVVRDSLLACAGRLDPLMGGQELENKKALNTFRRSLYYSCHPEGDGRSPMGALFDAPDPKECYRRTRSIVPQQALALTNSELIHSLCTDLAARLLDSDSSPDSFIIASFEQILSRAPSPAELAVCRQFVSQQHQLAESENADDPQRRAAESLVRVLFNHNDFIANR